MPGQRTITLHAIIIAQKFYICKKGMPLEARGDGVMVIRKGD